MPVIIVQGDLIEEVIGGKYPLQVATDGYMPAEDIDTKLPLIMASDGYLGDE